MSIPLAPWLWRLAQTAGDDRWPVDAFTLVDRRGDDVSGLAVNIAARVMAQADEGQIITSAIVTELTDCVAFAPIGSHRLKGIEGEWPLYVIDDRDDVRTR